MSPEKFRVAKKFGSQNLGPKRLWVSKILGPNKFWVPKKFMVPKFLWVDRIGLGWSGLVRLVFWVNRHFGLEKLSGPKNF